MPSIRVHILLWILATLLALAAGSWGATALLALALMGGDDGAIRSSLFVASVWDQQSKVPVIAVVFCVSLAAGYLIAVCIRLLMRPAKASGMEG